MKSKELKPKQWARVVRIKRVDLKHFLPFMMVGMSAKQQKRLRAIQIY